MKIKQTIKTFLVGAIILISGFVVATPQQTVFAADSCGGVETSIIHCDASACADKSTPTDGKCADGTDASKAVEDTGVWGVLIVAINILTAGVGVVAVGGVIYGAVLYTSAGGSPEQVKKAMGIITNVVIGVVAYALMFAGLNFLIPGGLFN